MKKIFLTLCCAVLSVMAYAQKTMPEIKVGTAMYASAYVQGQEFPLALKINSLTAPFSIGWAVDGYGEGSFEMSAKAMESANQFSSPTQPALGVTKLADTETFLVISKSAFQSLTDNKSFSYGGYKFVPSTTPKAIKVNGQEVDATHVVSDGSTKIELWILNNAAMPIILQSSGLATDISITEIK